MHYFQWGAGVDKTSLLLHFFSIIEWILAVSLILSSSFPAHVMFQLNTNDHGLEEVTTLDHLPSQNCH
jgi:hypothetical protein